MKRLAALALLLIVGFVGCADDAGAPATAPAGGTAPAIEPAAPGAPDMEPAAPAVGETDPS